MTQNKVWCKHRVYDSGCTIRGRICQNPLWKDGYCKAHHPDTVEACRVARYRKWQAKWDARDRAEKQRKRILKAEQMIVRAAEKWRDGESVSDGFVLTVAVDALREARDAKA